MYNNCFGQKNWAGLQLPMYYRVKHKNLDMISKIKIQEKNIKQRQKCKNLDIKWFRLSEIKLDLNFNIKLDLNAALKILALGIAKWNKDSRKNYSQHQVRHKNLNICR